MGLTFVALDDTTLRQWDSFVDANPDAWVGHHSAMIDFERAQGSTSLAHLVLGPGGEVRAVCPLFLSQERLARYVPVRSLTTGGSLRGAPLIEASLGAKKRRSFWREWAAWVVELAHSHDVDRIRVAFPHVAGETLSGQIYPYCPLRDFGFDQRANYTLLMDLRTAPQELISLMTPDQRRRVKKTLQAGAEVVQITQRERWLGECFQINQATFAGKEQGAYRREVMELIWDRFVVPGLAEVLAVEYEGQLLSVQTNVGTGHSYYAWLGFNRRPSPVAGSHSLLMLRCMERYRERGAAYFELGSLEFDDPAHKEIARFKRSFGSEIHLSIEGQRDLSALKLDALRMLQSGAATARQQATALRLQVQRLRR